MIRYRCREISNDGFSFLGHVLMTRSNINSATLLFSHIKNSLWILILPEYRVLCNRLLQFESFEYFIRTSLMYLFLTTTLLLSFSICLCPNASIYLFGSTDGTMWLFVKIVLLQGLTKRTPGPGKLGTYPTTRNAHATYYLQMLICSKEQCELHTKI